MSFDLTPFLVGEIQSAIEAVVANYHKRIYGLPHDDLVQEAWVGVLGALNTYEIQPKTSFHTWAYSVALYTLRRTVTNLWCPTPNHSHPERILHIRREECLEELDDPALPPDEDIAVREIRMRVRGRLEQMFGERAEERLDLDSGEVPLEVVAEQKGVPVAHVYRKNWLDRKVMKQDQVLHMLWKE